jgi:hypothetical protein
MVLWSAYKGQLCANRVKIRSHLLIIILVSGSIASEPKGTKFKPDYGGFAENQ